MKIVFFSTKLYDRRFFEAANHTLGYQLQFVDTHLNLATVPLAQDADAVCCFVNDVLNEATLSALRAGGTRFLVMRCAGYNNVDLAAARRLGWVEYLPIRLMQWRSTQWR